MDTKPDPSEPTRPRTLQPPATAAVPHVAATTAAVRLILLAVAVLTFWLTVGGPPSIGWIPRLLTAASAATISWWVGWKLHLQIVVQPASGLLVADTPLTDRRVHTDDITHISGTRLPAALTIRHAHGTLHVAPHLTDLQHLIAAVRQHNDHATVQLPPWRPS